MNTRNITKKQKEYFDECPKCKKEIKGTSESMVKFNMNVHQASKECVKSSEDGTGRKK